MQLIGRVFNLLRENSSEPAGDRRKLARDNRRTDMSRPPFRKVKTALPTMDICTRYIYAHVTFLHLLIIFD